MLKKLIVIMLAAALVISLSACGLGDNSAATDTQTGDLSGQATDVIDPTLDDSAAAVAQPDSVDESLADAQPSNGETVKMTLYFPTEDNSALKGEERAVEVYDKAIIKATVQALLQGAKTTGLHSAIPEGTGLNGVNLKDGVAIVDFTGQFASANDAEGVVERLSVVNTLTQIAGVEKVDIRVDGEELKGSGGEALGAMSPVALDENGAPLSAGN